MTKNNINTEQKKKNIKYKILILNISAILVISLLAVVSYAKYITTINASGSAQVAKWNFKVNDSNSENIGQIDLGTKQYTADTLTEGELAPGTSGEFSIKIDASGTKTGVDYDVAFYNIENKPTNLYFKVGENKYYDFNSLSEVLTGTIDADDSEKVKDINIEWAWDYVTERNGTASYNNEIDTNDGKRAGTFSFNIAVTGSQALPTM